MKVQRDRSKASQGMFLLYFLVVAQMVDQCSKGSNTSPSLALVYEYKCASDGQRSHLRPKSYKKLEMQMFYIAADLVGL